MKRVTSDALGIVNRSLGLAGADSSGATEFLDSVVFQGVDLSQLIRRGRTLAGSTGLFLAVNEHIHAGAGVLNNDVFPYAQAVGRQEPWPNPVPMHFDVWYLGASLNIDTAGAGTLTAAKINLNIQAPAVAWAQDDMDAATTISEQRVPLASWNAEETAGGERYGVGFLGAFEQKVIRIRRGTEIEFRSTVAGAALTVIFQVYLGLFPNGLGQDGAT